MDLSPDLKTELKVLQGKSSKPWWKFWAWKTIETQLRMDQLPTNGMQATSHSRRV